jgi:hypothetical protein
MTGAPAPRRAEGLRLGRPLRLVGQLNRWPGMTYQRSGGTHTAAIAPQATVTGQLEEHHAPRCS